MPVYVMWFGTPVTSTYARKPKVPARFGRTHECCKYKRKAISLVKLRPVSIAKPSRVQWRWEVILASASLCAGWARRAFHRPQLEISWTHK